jgi:hypothetical protein
MVGVLDQFTEGFARDVYAGEQGVARSLPCCSATVQYGNVRIANVLQTPRRKRRNATRAVVAQHDRRRPARHQCADVELQAAVRQRGRKQQMRCAELTRLAHVEQCELGAVMEFRFEFLRRELFHDPADE